MRPITKEVRMSDSNGKLETLSDERKLEWKPASLMSPLVKALEDLRAKVVEEKDRVEKEISKVKETKE